MELVSFDRAAEYESALPPRYAFCMRDVSHQCIGAEILGMHRENKNMFTKFTTHISASKDWCSYWEMDKFDRPSPSDYRNDREFWYNLNANFDLMDACWRSYLWTGDSLYLKDPAFRNFYDRSAQEYIQKWILQPDSLLTRPAYPNTPVPFNIDTPLRVTGFDTPYPPARVEEHYLPDLDRVLDAVDRSLAH